MKLFFDARFIRSDRHDGISRFSAELINSLSELVGLTVLVSNPSQLTMLSKGIPHQLVNDPTDVFKECLLPFKLNKMGATHVFSPMQTMGSVGRKYKLVLTQHDLIYYRHPAPPGWLNPLVKIAWRLYHLSFFAGRLLLNRADGVVTVSKTSKSLIEIHRLTKKPVEVIYNAPLRLEQSLLVKASWSKHSKTLVYMGSFMDYKNVKVLVRAMQYLPEFKLRLLSKATREQEITLMGFAEGFDERIDFAGGVSDSEYHEALSSSFALVSASKDEGFGIPLVEAMQQGLPIIVSDIPIFREVAGPAASYFNPDSPEDLAARVIELSNQTSWSNASEAGLTRARQFNWDESAEKLLRFIKRI